jgi:hypothetical protein
LAVPGRRWRDSLPMMTQDAGNLHLQRLLGAELILAYWIRKDWFVADAAVTYGIINDIYQRVAISFFLSGAHPHLLSYRRTYHSVASCRLKGREEIAMAT